jgi:hypothetical protein
VISRPPELASSPAQFVIHVVRIVAQVELLASQQLWPPPTFATIIESLGEVSVTTLFAAAYARFTSSLRANIGVWPPSTLWHVPQRFIGRMLSQRLILNDCTSGVFGAGRCSSASAACRAAGELLDRRTAAAAAAGQSRCECGRRCERSRAGEESGAHCPGDR